MAREQKKKNDKISFMLGIVIGFMLLALFSYFGSINLYLTLAVIAVITLITISFCMGAYLEEKEQKGVRNYESR
ncbi:hypothetical protein [Enterococcus dispar]|uniref:hypothetical protein n=1 Tax=Enterococcus dispar TaxID=44009 RepID=UPI0021D47A07|nr:hypothetical protein [Enterococcus dispar]MCU7356831.1 hypothetical protein [Enterococcus dispar]MDT2704932.1 hypothetical protein [Enterococcus dispar]